MIVSLIALFGLICFFFMPKGIKNNTMKPKDFKLVTNVKYDFSQSWKFWISEKNTYKITVFSFTDGYNCAVYNSFLYIIINLTID